MRFVHLTASNFLGGPERQMLGLATALPDCYTTTFLSFSEAGRCRPFLEAARAAGFRAVQLAHDTPSLWAALAELAAFLRSNRADVLVTHGYKSNLLGRAAARRAGIPIVSISRGWTGENLKVRGYEALDRFHLRFMDRVVCVSAAQADRVRRWGVLPERLRIIRNAARLSAFAAPRSVMQMRLRQLAGGDGPIILAVGRLSPEKGFHVLVESSPRLLGEVPAARIVLLGEGSERHRLQRRVAELGLGNRFRMPGFRDDVDELLPWADLVVLPSLTEGLPNVALEAGAASRPVVATCVGGTPEVVIDGETGCLVPPNDPWALARRMADLLTRPDRARALGAAGRRRVEEHFSFQRQAAAYQKLFEEVSQPGSRFRAPVACVS